LPNSVIPSAPSIVRSLVNTSSVWPTSIKSSHPPIPCTTGDCARPETLPDSIVRVLRPSSARFAASLLIVPHRESKIDGATSSV
jgi:hypothetical protein